MDSADRWMILLRLIIIIIKKHVRFQLSLYRVILGLTYDSNINGNGLRLFKISIFDEFSHISKTLYN